MHLLLIKPRCNTSRCLPFSSVVELLACCCCCGWGEQRTHSTNRNTQASKQAHQNTQWLTRETSRTCCHRHGRSTCSYGSKMTSRPTTSAASSSEVLPFVRNNALIHPTHPLADLLCCCSILYGDHRSGRNGVLAGQIQGHSCWCPVLHWSVPLSLLSQCDTDACVALLILACL